MGIIILGFAVGLRKQFALPNKSEWGYFALLGFLAITFHQLLQSNALLTSEASSSVALRVYLALDAHSYAAFWWFLYDAYRMQVALQ